MIDEPRHRNIREYDLDDLKNSHPRVSRASVTRPGLTVDDDGDEPYLRLDDNHLPRNHGQSIPLIISGRGAK